MESVVVELPDTAEEWAAFDSALLDAKLRELDVVQRRVEAAIVAVTGRADRSGHYLSDGHRNVAAWVMATTNCSWSEANARRRTANLLRTLERVAGEFGAGRVGIAQVRELARLAANPRCGDQLAGSEEVLLRAAQTLEFDDFRIVTQRWERLADADGAHRAHERAHERRNARLSVAGVEYRFETSHGVIQGASMRDVFEAFCQVEFDRDWQWAVDTYGVGATVDRLPRTAAQRRADAFTAMVLAAASAGAGTGRPIDVTVNLVTDLDQFEQYVAAEVVDRPVSIDPAGVRGRRCETTDGVAVDPRQMVAAALIGRIRLIVVDGAGVIVHAGHKRRLFNGALRQAIQAVDPVCGWLGCNIRAQIAAIDHLRPAVRGGPTDAGNGKVMCDRHNVFKHTHGYTVERNPDGTLTITRPDGTILRPPDAA